MGKRGVKKCSKLRDVIYGQPLNKTLLFSLDCRPTSPLNGYAVDEPLLLITTDNSKEINNLIADVSNSCGKIFYY
jgi:hypothetical protein